jgi:hypothetical protein
MAKKKAKKRRAPKARVKVSTSPPIVHHSELFKDIRPSKSRYIVIGTWALILAVIASVMLALIETPYLALVLVAIGFIVGFMNFEHEESVKFIVATISMLIIATALLMTGFSRLEITAPIVALYLRRAAYNVISVVAPAAFVLSLKALRELAE